MNLSQLRYFSVVLKRRSFRAAAEELHISQPALSNSVKKLEDLLGVQLLERGRQGISPTPFGEALNQYALSAIDAVNRGQFEIEVLKKGSKGHIRVGAPSGIIDKVLPAVMAETLKRQPDLSFSVTFGYLDALLEILQDGAVDFVFTTYWPHPSLTDNLVVEHLADVDLSIYARSTHPLANKAPITLDDLARSEWALYDAPGTNFFVRKLFSGAHSGALRKTVVSDHVPFIHAMMERHDLLSIIPNFAVSNFVDEGRFVRIEYPSVATEYSAGMIYLRDRTRTTSMMLFLEMARQVCAETLD